MKHILVIADGSALALAASVGWMHNFKRCQASFYYIEKEFINLTTEELSYLNKMGLNSEVKAQPLQQSSLDYVICVQQNGLEVAKTFQSHALVFDYHFNLDENKEDALLAMKQYFERFCKMYLNEYMI
jgi:hypothetical protein